MISRISNIPRAYAWGSHSLIAELQGRKPSGEPEAELWLGDHPGSPSLVEDGSGRQLPEWLAAEEEGQWRHLPYLLKLLAAAEPLSIQAHPSKTQAVAGYARENELAIPVTDGARNYKDDNHKPELIVALSDRFDALAGFRDLAATSRLLAELEDAPGVEALRSRAFDAPGGSVVRETVQWLLSAATPETIDDIIRAVQRAKSEEFAKDLEVLQRVADARPGDPGVAVALLMNVVSLRRGEAIYVRAGVVHAYLDGLGIELMAASDNVLRGGLTPKRIDVDELLTVLDTRPGPPPIVTPSRVSGGVDRFEPDVPDFVLTRVRVDGSGSAHVPTTGPAIVLAVSGRVTVRGERSETSLPLAPGESLIATSDECALFFEGDGELFIAQPGVPPGA